MRELVPCQDHHALCAYVKLRDFEQAKLDSVERVGRPSHKLVQIR